VPATAGPAAPERRTARVGWLDAGRGAEAAANRESLQQALVGYVAADALIIAERYAEGREEHLPALADELVKGHVDVVLAVGTAAVKAARQATATVPIVMLAPRTDSGRAGPDAPNITGVTFEGPPISRRRLELVKMMVPGAKRVAVHAVPGDAAAALGLRESQAAAEALGLTVVAVEARNTDELAQALAAARAPRPDALIVPATSASLGPRDQLVKVTARARMPTMFAYREFVDAGALASYGPNLAALFRRAGTLVGKILIGAAPRDLPIEAPSRFEFIVSRTAARTLGFELPAAVLGRADEVR
jgi:putative ABC transport system substrate-binding protein